MNRNKMTIEIVAELYDEQGFSAGRVTIYEKNGVEMAVYGDCGADVLALAERLKKAHQRWLDADEATLDAGVSMALGVEHHKEDSNG